jgi:methyltransferase (TIGR00027 family)
MVRVVRSRRRSCVLCSAAATIALAPAPRTLSAQSAPSETIAAELFTGIAWSLRTPLVVDLGGERRVIRAHWSTRPFADAPYYSYRLARASVGREIAAEMLHHKLYLENPVPPIGRLEVSHGYNEPMFDVSPRAEGFRWRCTRWAGLACSGGGSRFSVAGEVHRTQLAIVARRRDAVGSTTRSPHVVNESSHPAGARNQTALGVAWLRAAHQLVDAEPRILDDAPSVALLGHQAAEVRSDPRAHSPGARVLRAHIVLRSRFAEDRLRLAVERGVVRYVVLGAGYDTFLVRQPAWARKIEIVEVDREEIQEDKRAKLAAARFRVPNNVRFVSIDFEHESLASGLARNGVRLDDPTFFSWLGVTMYLTEPAIDAVLATVAATPRGSEIVFTFAPADPVTGGPASPELSGLASLAATAGEPWRTYFAPEELVAKLRTLGFSSVELLAPDDAAQRYFAGRTDGLPAPRRSTIVSAVV